MGLEFTRYPSLASTLESSLPQITVVQSVGFSISQITFLSRKAGGFLVGLAATEMSATVLQGQDWCSAHLPT